MKIGLWEFIKKPENVPYVITIFIAILVAILGFLKLVSAVVLISAILLVLSSIVSLLIILHSQIRNFQEKLKSPSIGELFKSFHKMEDEIRKSIKHAEEIWLLSRTGQGWWKNFGKEFDKKLSKLSRGNVRFLFLDPENGALEMVAKSRKLEWQDTPDMTIKESVRQFLNYLKNKYNDKLDLKVIDHLPAWTLLIINPNKKDEDTVIYVELAQYRATSEERPTFKVTPQEGKYFEDFLNEFEAMWQDGKNLKNENKCK